MIRTRHLVARKPNNRSAIVHPRWPWKAGVPAKRSWDLRGPWRPMRRALLPLLAVGCAALVIGFPASAADQAPAQPPVWQGMWSGRSVIWEKVMDDTLRKLTRTSEADFWFVVNADGQAHGEGFVTYQAELKALKWKVPIPNAGSIEAEVGGGSGKEIRKFGILGRVTDKQTGRHPRAHETCPLELSLQAMGEKDGKAAPEENGTIPGITFQFTIEASVAVPAGAGGGALPGAQPGIFSIPIPAKGWSPFQGLHPTIEGHPGEPLRATAESKGTKFFILWYAVQQTP